MKKLKDNILWIALYVAMLTGVLATSLEWSPNKAEDNVQMYVIEHRGVNDVTWTRVEVAASQNRVEIPESAYSRWFRIAAVNSFGQSDWTTPVKLPEKVIGLKIILEITP